MIHILGDGPYAREVKSYMDYKTELQFAFVTDDANCFPVGGLVLGIADPKIKRYVMEEFYGEIHREIFLSAMGHMVVCASGSTEEIFRPRCLNIGHLTSIGLNVSIEDFVSICSNVTIGHDIRIMRYSTIAPGAIISGNVHIGEGSFIGAGAVIKDGIIIGDNAVVGCGAVVVEDARSNHVVVGNPARFLKFNDPV